MNDNGVDQTKELQIISIRDDAKSQLMQIKDIDSGTDFLDKTKALEAYAKATRQDSEMVKMIQEQKIRSMRILGQLLEQTDLNTGSAGSGNPNWLGGSNTRHPSEKPTLSDYGITRDESSTYQTIAAIPIDVFEQQMDEIKADTSTVKEITITRFKNVGKDFKQKQKVQDAAVNQWPEDEEDLRRRCEQGETVVINMNKHFHLLNWAMSEGMYVRVDRFTEWGNPFELGKDGDRDEVCDAYELHYFPFKKSLHRIAPSLKGKVLGCHCHPLRCHGHFLANQSNTVKR